VKASDDITQTCLVTRTHRDLDQYDAALRELGVSTYRIRRSEAEDRSKPGLRLATMHRVKGLEFDRMIIAGVNEGTVPLLVGDAESDDRGVPRRSGAPRARASLRGEHPAPAASW
jgi:superfamily I DNA/RNA helicase